MARRVSRLQLGGQAPFETRSQPLLDVGDFRRRRIGRDHDLLAAIEERVEGVEKFLLRTVLARQELDVVDQQHVDLTVALAKLLQLAVLDRADVVVGELLRRDVENLEVLSVLLDEMPDRLHQVGLAQADAAMQEKRIVGPRRRVRHRLRRGMRELIVHPDDERLEGAARIKGSAGIDRGRNMRTYLLLRPWSIGPHRRRGTVSRDRQMETNRDRLAQNPGGGRLNLRQVVLLNPKLINAIIGT
jgi:hypothetical protein